jgi:hypothetical protein
MAIRKGSVIKCFPETYVQGSQQNDPDVAIPMSCRYVQAFVPITADFLTVQALSLQYQNKMGHPIAMHTCFYFLFLLLKFIPHTYRTILRHRQ